MNNNEIAIFSVSKTITQRILTVLVEKKLDIPVFEPHYFDVLEKAEELIRGGTKIIISRGGTAALLRNHVSIPIIEIAHDFYGIYRILQEARAQSKKIATVGFPQYCNVLRHYQNLTNDEFKICQVYNHHDIENVIKKLAEDGYQIVIGGLTVAEMAEKYGLTVIMGDTDNISIEQALNEAFSLLKYIRYESSQLSISYAALNQAREGIMCIDQSGEVIKINEKGLDLFKCHLGEGLFKKTEFKPLYNSIINELNVKDQPLEINGEVIHVRLKHVTNKYGFFSIISAVSSDNVFSGLQRHKKSDSKGFIANYSFADIIYQSDVMSDVINKAKKFARYDLPVNIFGETGTGKELFAQSIHNESDRKSEPFIAVNCAAIPESIIESELFGYADGAFTNARKGGRAGIFEMALNGTVFIDEISEAPLSVQIKLLRVLQEKAFSRIGGDSLISANFRLITASNKRLDNLVDAGSFRQDLYYRINVLELALPPLFQRTGDMMLIVENLLAKQGKRLVFTDDAIAFMNNHPWPGNIRELQAVIYRLMVLSDSGMIDTEALIKKGLISTSHKNESTSVTPAVFSLSDKDLLRKQEANLISEVLKKTNGDRAQASIILGISQTTLWRKLKEIEDSSVD